MPLDTIIIFVLGGFGIIFLIMLISHIPFYFMMASRRRHMQKLAEEFRLTMEDSFPGFFTILNIYFFKNLAINRIQGNIAGHVIHIFDVYHFSLREIDKYYQRETIIEIDGKVERQRYGNFVFTGSSLSSADELRKILKGIKMSRSPFEE